MAVGRCSSALVQFTHTCSGGTSISHFIQFAFVASSRTVEWSCGRCCCFFLFHGWGWKLAGVWWGGGTKSQPESRNNSIVRLVGHLLFFIWCFGVSVFRCSRYIAYHTSHISDDDCSSSGDWMVERALTWIDLDRPGKRALRKPTFSQSAARPHLLLFQSPGPLRDSLLPQSLPALIPANHISFIYPHFRLTLNQLASGSAVC